MTNFYEILGVDKNASPEEIKKAYRSLSKIHHPDVGGDEEEFKKISEAYTTLSDEAGKKHYDDFGCAPNSEESKHMLIVVNSLCLVFDQMCASLTPEEFESYDLIGTLRVSVECKIDHMKSLIANVKKQIQQVSKLKSILEERLKRKADVKPTPNFFIGTLNKRIAIAEQDLVAHEYQLKVAEDMCNLINEYEFNFDKNAEQNPFVQYAQMDGRGRRGGLMGIKF